MQLAEAIKMALDYEGRVHALYLDAVKAATDAAGRRVFQVLADEEKTHLDFLHACQKDWERDGHLTAENLATAIPPKERIAIGLEKLRARLKPQSGKYPAELEKLRQALDVELETSAFYQRMAGELSGEGRALFERFVEIEEGHVAIVQAEIDSVSGLGYWFDHREFDLEGA